MKVNGVHRGDGVEADVGIPDAVGQERWVGSVEGLGAKGSAGHALLDNFGSL